MTSTPRWHGSLLPGALREDWDGRRSARDWLVDVVLALLALGISTAVLLDTADEHGRGMIALDLALGAVAFAALWWRRTRPELVGVLATVLAVTSAFAAGPALVAAFNVALRGTRRAIYLVVALGLASSALFPVIYPSGDAYGLELVLGVLITALVFGWGLLARVRLEQLLALRDRAAQAEAEQRRRLEQAREAERRRIAREMHDVLAHRVSLLSLHAGALEFRPDASPAEVAAAAGVIRAAAHATLEDLREVIGVLREGGGDEAPEPPQPTLAAIPALVDESRAAGMRVRCRMDVAGVEAVPTAVGRTAYRVVQEGLTNARKHASAAAVDVAVTASDRLVVEVVSRQRVGATAATAPTPGAGLGLIGLQERLALAGGELEHGPDAAGDFVLRATLPWGGA